MENAYELLLPNTLFRDLSLSFCGMSECKPGHQFGPAVRPNYIIHYVLKGKGIYQVGEKKYEVCEGQGFLIEPEVLTHYKADEEEPWTYIWIGFSGDMAKTYLSDIGLNSEQLVFRCGQKEELKSLVLKMTKHSMSSVTNQYYLQSYLYQFFAVLTKEIKIDSVVHVNKESLYVREAVNFIRNNYFRGINVTDVAEHISVNRSYLYKLFQNSFQMSPKEFLTNFRISRAKELLVSSELPIESIAWSCGYSEVLVFSKMFKKIVGVAPSVYRKDQQKTVHAQHVDVQDYLGTEKNSLMLGVK